METLFNALMGGLAGLVLGMLFVFVDIVTYKP